MRHAFPVIPGQEHLATSRQLRAAGWTRAAINTLSSVHGQQVLHRVYFDSRAELSAENWLIAGWLWAGPNAILTGASALARHGLALHRTPALITYLVRPGQRNRACGRVRTVRAKDAPEPRLLGGIPCAPIERALTDMGRYGEASVESLRAITIGVLQQRASALDRLVLEVDAGRPNGTLGVRLGLDDFARGAWSLPEVTLERLLAGRRRSYDFLANPRLMTPGGRLIGVPDGYLPRYGIAIQVHSRQFHSGMDAVGRDRWEATVEADSAYAAHGIAVLGVAPTGLRDAPDRFLERLDELVWAQRKRPTPQIIVQPRSQRGVA